MVPTSGRAPREGAESERKNLAVERVTGPGEVGLFDPDAEGEDEERAEMD
jgi:hypothetical protein